MPLFFRNRDGHTPLDVTIIDDLIPHHVQDMTELYELEAENIALAISWSFSTGKDHLDHHTWLDLHKHMLCDVWKFAGKIRKIELQNPDFLKVYELRPAFLELERDLKTWLEFKSYPPQEMMAILHERLLTIHPFRDGNGRWSRILVDFISRREGLELPSWSRSIQDDGLSRETYITAVKRARREKDYQPLIDYMYQAE